MSTSFKSEITSYLMESGQSGHEVVAERELKHIKKSSNFTKNGKRNSLSVITHKRLVNKYKDKWFGIKYVRKKVGSNSRLQLDKTQFKKCLGYPEQAKNSPSMPIDIRTESVCVDFPISEMHAELTRNRGNGNSPFNSSNSCGSPENILSVASTFSDQNRIHEPKNVNEFKDEKSRNIGVECSVVENTNKQSNNIVIIGSSDEEEKECQSSDPQQVAIIKRSTERTSKLHLSKKTIVLVNNSQQSLNHKPLSSEAASLPKQHLSNVFDLEECLSISSNSKAESKCKSARKHYNSKSRRTDANTHPTPANSTSKTATALPKSSVSTSAPPIKWQQQFMSFLSNTNLEPLSEDVKDGSTANDEAGRQSDGEDGTSFSESDVDWVPDHQFSEQSEDDEEEMLSLMDQEEIENKIPARSTGRNRKRKVSRIGIDSSSSVSDMDQNSNDFDTVPASFSNNKKSSSSSKQNSPNKKRSRRTRSKSSLCACCIGADNEENSSHYHKPKKLSREQKHFMNDMVRLVALRNKIVQLFCNIFPQCKQTIQEMIVNQDTQKVDNVIDLVISILREPDTDRSDGWSNNKTRSASRKSADYLFRSCYHHGNDSIINSKIDAKYSNITDKNCSDIKPNQICTNTSQIGNLKTSDSVPSSACHQDMELSAESCTNNLDIKDSADSGILVKQNLSVISKCNPELIEQKTGTGDVEMTDIVTCGSVDKTSLLYTCNSLTASEKSSVTLCLKEIAGDNDSSPNNAEKENDKQFDQKKCNRKTYDVEIIVNENPTEQNLATKSETCSSDSCTTKESKSIASHDNVFEMDLNKSCENSKQQQLTLVDKNETVQNLNSSACADESMVPDNCSEISTKSIHIPDLMDNINNNSEQISSSNTENTLILKQDDPRSNSPEAEEDKSRSLIIPNSDEENDVITSVISSDHTNIAATLDENDVITSVKSSDHTNIAATLDKNDVITSVKSSDNTNDSAILETEDTGKLETSNLISTQEVAGSGESLFVHVTNIDTKNNEADNGVNLMNSSDPEMTFEPNHYSPVCEQVSSDEAETGSQYPMYSDISEASQMSCDSLVTPDWLNQAKKNQLIDNDNNWCLDADILSTSKSQCNSPCRKLLEVKTNSVVDQKVTLDLTNQDFELEDQTFQSSIQEMVNSCPSDCSSSPKKPQVIPVYDCMISVCPKPGLCLEAMRKRLIGLFRCLLPEFDLKRKHENHLDNLEYLLDAVISCNNLKHVDEIVLD